MGKKNEINILEAKIMKEAKIIDKLFEKLYDLVDENVYDEIKDMGSGHSVEYTDEINLDIEIKENKIVKVKQTKGEEDDN